MIKRVKFMLDILLWISNKHQMKWLWENVAISKILYTQWKGNAILRYCMELLVDSPSANVCGICRYWKKIIFKEIPTFFDSFQQNIYWSLTHNIRLTSILAFIYFYEELSENKIFPKAENKILTAVSNGEHVLHADGSTWSALSIAGCVLY